MLYALFLLLILLPMSQTLLRPCSLRPCTRLFSSQSSLLASSRIDLLHQHLNKTHNLDPSDITLSRVGPSAFKAYNTYLSPSPSKLAAFLASPQQVLSQLATQTSNQIAFLTNRHLAATNPSIRNTDTLQPSKPKFPLILILDNLRSAMNVGSLLRSADACSVTSVMVSRAAEQTRSCSPKRFMQKDRLKPRCSRAMHAERLSQTALFARHARGGHFVRSSSMHVVRSCLH